LELSCRADRGCICLHRAPILETLAC
jgi:hypothetical protein